MESWEIGGEGLRLQNFLSVFSGFRLILFVVFLVFSFFVFAFASGILLFPSLDFNPLIDYYFVFLVFLISVLFAANLLVVFYGFNLSKSFLLGSFSGVFTTSCAFCAPTFMAWLGLGSFFGFLSSFSFYFGLLSVFLLSYSLWFSLGDCEVKKHGKGV
ncbi:MAG: hypothetical protein QXI10_00885 [Candidatus Diapherotrites archaeon]